MWWQWISLFFFFFVFATNRCVALAHLTDMEGGWKRRSGKERKIKIKIKIKKKTSQGKCYPREQG